MLPSTEILPVTIMDPLNNSELVICNVSVLLENTKPPAFPFTEKSPFTFNELVISTLPVNICLFESNEPNAVLPVTISVEAVMFCT
jgi:hypothetical protein